MRMQAKRKTGRAMSQMRSDRRRSKNSLMVARQARKTSSAGRTLSRRGVQPMSSPSAIRRSGGSDSTEIEAAWIVSTLGCARCLPEKTPAKMAMIWRRLTPLKRMMSARPSEVSAGGAIFILPPGELRVRDDEGAVGDLEPTAVGLDGDAVRHAPDEADQDGQAVAGRAHELEPVVRELEDVGDEADADNVEGVAADYGRVGPALAIAELDEVDLTAAAGDDRIERFFGGRDVEVAEEGIAGPGRDLADLGQAGGAAVGVEPVDELIRRAVAAEAEKPVVAGAGGLTADLDGVAGVLGDADLETRGRRPGGAGSRRSKTFLPRPCPAAGLTTSSVFMA